MCASGGQRCAGPRGAAEAPRGERSSPPLYGPTSQLGQNAYRNRGRRAGDLCRDAPTVWSQGNPDRGLEENLTLGPKTGVWVLKNLTLGPKTGVWALKNLTLGPKTGVLGIKNLTLCRLSLPTLAPAFHRRGIPHQRQP